MNGLMAVEALADFGGRDVAGHGGEQMNDGFAQHDLVWIVHFRAAELFRWDDQAQRVQTKARTAGDDEIAGIEKRFVIFPRRDFQELVRADNEVQVIVGMFATESPDGINRVENMGRSPV